MGKLSLVAILAGLFLAACASPANTGSSTDTSASSNSGNTEVYGEVKGGIEHSHSH